MAAERNPFEIPSVLEILFAHSSFSSLLQFRLVNSTWNFDATSVARKISSGKESSVSPIPFRRHWLEECQFYFRRFNDGMQDVCENTDTILDEFNACVRNSLNSFSFPSTCFRFFSLDLRIQDLRNFIHVFGAQVRKLEIDAGDFEGRDLNSFSSEENFVECLVRDFPNLKYLILGTFAYSYFPSSFDESETEEKQEEVKFLHQNLSSIKLKLNQVDALKIDGYPHWINTKLIQTLLDSAVNLEEFINFEVDLLPAFTTGTRQNIQRKLETITEFQMIKFQLMEMDDLESQQEILTFLEKLQEFAETAPSLTKLSIFNVQKKPSPYPFPDDENDPFENDELTFDEFATRKFEKCLSLLLNSSLNSLEEISLHPLVCQRPLHQIFPQNPLKNVKTVKINDFFQWFRLTGKKSLANPNSNANENEDQKQEFLLGPDFGHFLSPFFPNIQKFVIDLGNQTGSFKKFQFQLMDLKFSLPRSIQHLEIVSNRTGKGLGRFLQEIQDAILRQNLDSDYKEKIKIQIERLTLKFSLFDADFTEILQSIFDGAAWRNLTHLELRLVEDFHGTDYSYFEFYDRYDLFSDDEVDLSAALGGLKPKPTWEYQPEGFCSPWSLCGISDENEFQSQVEKLKEKKLRGSINQLSQLRWLSIDLGNDFSKIVKLNFVGIFLACESLPNLSIKVNVARKNLAKMRENIFGQIQSARFNSRVFVTSGEELENLERKPRAFTHQTDIYFYR